MNYQEQLEALRNRFENMDKYYADNRKSYFEVNVKMHGIRYIDPVDIANELTDNETEKQRLIEQCNDNQIQSIYDWYIESEGEYAKDWLGGVAYNKTEAEMQHLEAIEMGKYAFFAGRSGGHFCIYPTQNIEAMIDEAHELLDDDENIDENIQNITKTLDSIAWVQTELQNMKRGVENGWRDELKCQMQDVLSTIREDIEAENKHAAAVREALLIVERDVKQEDKDKVKPLIK